MDAVAGDKRPFSSVETVVEVDAGSVTEIEAIRPTVKSEVAVDGEEHAVIVPPRDPDLVYLKKTGISYDTRMRYHSHPNPTVESYLDRHPEDPRRTFMIYRSIAEAGLITDATLQGGQNLGELMQKLPTRAASDDEILLVHTPEHLSYINSIESMSDEQLLHETQSRDSIYLNNDSSLAARLSCGSVIEACRSVVEGRVRNAIAVVRPPGHHAEPDAPGGFCLFSNVAVASRVILRDYPDKIRKILIYDWDIHHGNGTARAFEDEPSVLYISTHRHNGVSFYPGKPYAEASEVGRGEGEGYSVNIPWPKPGMGDGDYMAAFNRIIMPIAFEYNPDLVIISAGFDAAKGDYIGQCNVTPPCYAYMTHQLKALAQGNLVVSLEGGYNLDAISNSALAVTKVLLGDPPPRIENPLPSSIALDVLEQVAAVQSKYWKCLQPRPERIWAAVRSKQLQSVSGVIRGYEARILARRYNFAPLPILGYEENDKVTFSLDTDDEDFILTTPGIYTAPKVLVIFHDPATVWSLRHTNSGELRSADIFSGSLGSPFVEWGLAHGFGVVDVQVPGTSAAVPTVCHHVSSEDAQKLAKAIVDKVVKTIIRYLEAESVSVVAIGTAYPAAVDISTKRNVPKLESFIGFVPDDVQLRGQKDLSSEEWFGERALVVTVKQHPYFSSTKKGKKKPLESSGIVLQATDSMDIFSAVREKFSECLEFLTYEE